ncbi:hypothetical protein [Spirillospora albida]|uniref:hypothetical protein n=1 Tax=Spirillospora albida TaxID=58123 RepID=UPI000AE55F82|nr:hypothetical protein [Spirillospora albida]
MSRELLIREIHTLAPGWAVTYDDGWHATRDDLPGAAGATAVRAVTGEQLREVLAEMDASDARVALRALKVMLRGRGIVANLYGQTLSVEAARRSATVAVHRGIVRWTHGAEIGPMRDLADVTEKIAKALL